MTPDELEKSRQSLGLTPVEFATVLRFKASSVQALRNRASELKTGRAVLDDARAELLRAYIHGYRPTDWPMKDRARRGPKLSPGAD